MATIMAMIIVIQFHGAIESLRKPRLEVHFVENDRQKSAAITEIQSSLLESDKFDNASSNNPPPLLPSLPPSIAPLNSLPPNELLQSDEELKASTDIACKHKEITNSNDCITNSNDGLTTVVEPKNVPSYLLKAPTETNNRLTTVMKPKNVPSYIPKAYSRFISHVNKLETLNGLKFIGIVSGLKLDKNPYLWHQTDNPNSTTHEGNHLIEFSYTVLRLDKFPKEFKQLKNIQDNWISLILNVSEMTEEEADEIFGDEPVFQKVLQILKLDNLTLEESQEYLHSEKIRRSEVDSNKYKAMRDLDITIEILRVLSAEMGIEIPMKIELEIERRRNRNKAIVMKEIVGPIVDEYFDDQGFMKICTEVQKSGIIDILKRYQSSIPYDATDLREKWSHEEIENLKEKITYYAIRNPPARSIKFISLTVLSLIFRP
jgi:hypothetical protein